MSDNNAKEKICENCFWRSCKFTSVCTNDESPHVADFVSNCDTCSQWEDIKDGKLF